VKDKLTQVRLWEEIIVSESKIQRSQMTGSLLVTMKKAKQNDNLISLVAKEERQRQDKTRLVAEEKDKVQKSKESNLKELMESKKRSEELSKLIQEDTELDDLPDLE
jgi:hypothetical protein